MRKIKRHINNNSKAYSQASLVCGYMFAMYASLTGDMKAYPWEGSFYHLNELAFFMYLLCTYLLITNNTPKWSINWQAFALLVLWSSVTTLADEVSKSAISVDLNDFIRLGFVLIYVIIWRKWKKKREKRHGNRE